MTAHQWHMKIMNRMVQGHVPFDKSEFVRRAQSVVGLSDMTYEGFLIEDSDLGDTRAKPEIWTSMEKYKSESDKFSIEAAKLLAISQGSNIEAIKTQFGKTLNSCDSCHATFRSR